MQLRQQDRAGNPESLYEIQILTVAHVRGREAYQHSRRSGEVSLDRMYSQARILISDI